MPRQAISGIRRAIQNQEYESPFLLITDETMRTNPAGDSKVDCLEYNRIFEQTASHRHVSINSCASCLQALSKIVELYKGDFLGESALFVGEIRSSSARVLGKANVLTVDRRSFLKQIQQDPTLAFRLVETLTLRIKELDQDVVVLSRALQECMQERMG